MLTSMRKNAGSLIIKLLLGAVVVVFVFWGVGTNQQSSNPEVASIEGQPIGYDEFARAYQQLQDNVRRQFGSNLNEETLKALNLKEQALNQLIDRVILVREAQAMGFRVSDEELTRHIRSISAFQSNGQFSRSQYEQVLVQFRMTPEAFEAAQRDDLMIQQVSDIVSRTAKVTQGEVTDWYRWQNATVNLEYVLFKPDPKAVINLNDDEVRSYFEENRNGYQTTSERSLRYLVFHSADYRPQVRLAADDVSAYYEEHIDEFEMPETIEARHILFKVGQDADQAAVDATRARAQEVYNQVLNGADFAELAKTHSEGPTRDAGGYLGAFGRGQMVKAFEEEAFAMDAGQVSEPVRTEFGWHIIKVEKKNPARSRSLAEADNKIRGQLTGGFARELALEDAEAAYDLSYGDEDLAAVAKQLGRELHTTGMVARNDAIEGVSDAAAFSRTAFDLNAGGISEVQEIGGDFYIIQVEEIKAPQVPALDSVRDRVKEDLKQEKRWEQAETRADAFLKTLREGGRMEELSTAQALPLKTTGFFKRSDAIPEIGRQPEMAAAAFELAKEKPWPESPIRSNNGFYVFRFLERKQPQSTSSDAQLDPVRAQLLQRKQRTLFDAWLADAKARTEITIDRSALE